jgi:hypothetical protein
VKHKGVLPLRASKLGGKKKLTSYFPRLLKKRILHLRCFQVYISKLRETADKFVLVSFRLRRKYSILWHFLSTNWVKSEFSSVARYIGGENKRQKILSETQEGFED